MTSGISKRLKIFLVFLILSSTPFVTLFSVGRYGNTDGYGFFSWPQAFIYTMGFPFSFGSFDAVPLFSILLDIISIFVFAALFSILQKKNNRRAGLFLHSLIVNLVFAWFIFLMTFGWRNGMYFLETPVAVMDVLVAVLLGPVAYFQGVTHLPVDFLVRVCFVIWTFMLAEFWYSSGKSNGPHQNT